ncbi:Crp/Fnr family transcriptional regulator [Mucilaginibacter myungsuensis]|uniref:Crp/Fnr family transcriptional regulator n=1 Tax=Mucilaginibacter myungsuensis TaxID=649104 RepID=A0A929PV29_9SPHI|nr:Crp/Fnr family transcriptional regulator [Mucilaginibacter myungsuensis]MBE9661383.1 Crp/Fnr family transcriptional regulator [Mucilaginibacter myungsuensis]MDN3597526.1 Crp/Fnr family transcriptional regulator [Mucilaginibacter myungsuensis]
MFFELILNNVCKLIQLTEPEKEQFVSYLHPKTMRKKEFLLRQGEVCKYSAFVLSGCLRGYSIDKNGTEHVLSFAPADWWMADMYSLISQQPGVLNIEALEETEMLLLSKINQDKLYADIPKFERFFRILAEKSLVANQQRLIDRLSLTGEERYKIFCDRYPTLINHLPQKQIAAYIGVSPEFLSRARAEMARSR